jgi:hypothetical protein
MVLILKSAIAVAVSVFRYRHTSGHFTRLEIAEDKTGASSEPAAQSSVASPTKQFLVVLLPDGKMVNPKVVG